LKKGLADNGRSASSEETGSDSSQGRRPVAKSKIFKTRERAEGSTKKRRNKKNYWEGFHDRKKRRLRKGTPERHASR